MVTCVDTNVISYLLLDADPDKAAAAQTALDNASGAGRIVVCGPVFAELLAAGAWDQPALLAGLSAMRLDLELDFDRHVWVGASVAYARYLAARRPADYTCPRCLARQRFRCRQCGQELSRPKHVLSDFLIGAFAQSREYALLTDDVTRFPHI